MIEGIVSLRPFVPAKDFAQSKEFYETLGFQSRSIGPQMTHMQLGPDRGRFAFILQDYYVEDFAKNLVMHFLLDDVEEWWNHIDSLSLDKHFPVPPPKAPKLQPWGLRVSYVIDPAGVLWQFAEDSRT